MRIFRAHVRGTSVKKVGEIPCNMFGSSFSTSACQRGGVESGNYTVYTHQAKLTMKTQQP